MATGLQDLIPLDAPKRLAAMLREVWPQFPARAFVTRVEPGFSGLGLMDRGRRMADALQAQIRQLVDLSTVQRRFVSDVSHELRTPLTTVRMASDVIHDAKDSFDPVTARAAELLQVELDRFEGLLADLLEISRFDAGAAGLELDEVDLVEVARRVVDSTVPLAARREVRVVVEPGAGPVRVEADQRRVAIAPVGDRDEQGAVGLRLRLRYLQRRVACARIGERQARRQAERRRGIVRCGNAQRAFDRFDDDERRVTRRGRAAFDPIGRQPPQPHREIAPRRRTHDDPLRRASGRWGRGGSW